MNENDNWSGGEIVKTALAGIALAAIVYWVIVALFVY